MINQSNKLFVFIHAFEVIPHPSRGLVEENLFAHGQQITIAHTQLHNSFFVPCVCVAVCC